MSSTILENIFLRLRQTKKHLAWVLFLAGTLSVNYAGTLSLPFVDVCIDQLYL